MRILQVIDSLHIGGAERLLIETVPLLVERGIDIDVVLLNGDRTSFYDELKKSKSCNIISLGQKYYSFIFFYKLYKLSKDYDVIHVHLFPAQYYVSILKWFGLIKKKIVFTEHSTSNRRLQNKMFKPLEELIYKQYSNVICITNKVKDVLLTSLSIDCKKLIVIENGVNISKVVSSIGYEKESYGYKSEDVVLIMVAGFRREKDQDTVIDALNLLPEHYKLILIGDGERKEVVEKLVEKLNLKSRVSFLGIRTDVYSLIKMCDIAILSSHWEGFGLVAVEAMASGIPLIASNVEGLAQVVKNGGLLFESGNSKDLVEKIIFLEDEILYSSVVRDGVRKANDYDISLMIDKLIQVYEA